MADQDEDYSSLPLVDRATHKVCFFFCLVLLFHISTYVSTIIINNENHFFKKKIRYGK